jgi:hypothetical protein
LQAADVALLRLQEARQRAKHLNGHRLRNGADIGSGLVGEG